VNLENTWMAKDNSKSVFISAKYKTNIENLKDIIYGMVKEIHTKRYPYEDFLF